MKPETLKRLPFYGILLLLTVTSVFPFVFALSTSLKLPDQVFSPNLIPHPATLQNYLQLLSTTPLFGRWILNSLVLAAMSVSAQLVFGSMAGYAFARIRFPGREFLFWAMLGSMMIPGQMLWIPNYATLSHIGLVNTLFGVLLPDLVLANSVFLMTQFFKGIPRELEEASVLDGMNRFGTFFRIVLPLAGPMLATLTVISFMASWNNFAWPVIVLSSPQWFTLPLGLNYFHGVYITRWTLVMAASMFNTVPVLLIFTVCQRYFIKGIATAGLKD